MIRLLLKVLSFGWTLGIRVSIYIMMIACILYFILEMTDVYVPRHFLGYAAWVSFASGVLCVIGCLVYVLWLAREYFKAVIKQSKKDE